MLTGLLLFWAPALQVGCLQPVVIPRFDVGGPPADPHGIYAKVDLGGGSVLKLGVETGGKDERPWVALVGADGKVVWQHSYGRLGQGGHAVFVAGARLTDGTLLAAAANTSITTLALVGFEPDGRVRWAQELDLPAPASGRASVITEGGGAVVSVPVEEQGGPARTLSVRVDASGAVLSRAPRDLREELARTGR